MAKAEEYKICCALFDAYIAKVSKNKPNEMTDDRRPITESEILTLIDWNLERWVTNHEHCNGFAFEGSDGRTIEVHYVDKPKEN